jgi:deoxyxylulose-5-phosphate synthase
MGIEDIACIRSLPNIGIIQPADELETKQAIAFAVEHQGPLYLRLTRQNLEPVCPSDYRFQYGRWLVLRKGHDVTLIGTGGPLFNCLEAAKSLQADGISAGSSTPRASSRWTSCWSVGGKDQPRRDRGRPRSPAGWRGGRRARGDMAARR